MFVEPLLWVRLGLPGGTARGQTWPLGRELRVHRGDNTRKVVSGARMEVGTSFWEDTRNGHLAHSESSRKAAWRRWHSAGS